ncbi:MAG: hypothetical protein MZW92_71740 [Comamonadaceae bacterium]|nr:hypothetical protein [Comamonadaceae bacterium]
MLDGTTYAEVARQAGVSRTLVEQRVKAVARELAVERRPTGRGARCPCPDPGAASRARRLD